MEDDNEKEEEEIEEEENEEEEEENEEEEEDLNDIPLFEDTSEVIVELLNHNESSLVPTESASAPPTSSILAQGSDLRTEDLQEEEEIMKFFENGCGNDCHKLFSESYIRKLRSDMLQMTRSEYNLVIVTQIKATSTGGQTVGNKKRAHERQRDTYNYMHEGQKVVLYHLNMNLIVY